MVIDGRVIAHGESLDDYPKETEIRRACEERGKFPFVFVNELLLAVEEGGTRRLPAKLALRLTLDFVARRTEIEVRRRGEEA